MTVDSISYYSVFIAVGIFISHVFIQLQTFLLRLCIRLSTKKASSPDLSVVHHKDTKTPINIDTNIESLLSLTERHDYAREFYKLVKEDGAGSWPPAANFDEWPASLQPYQDLYLRYTILLTVSDPSLSDDANRMKRHQFRTAMRSLLQRNIDLDQMRQTLEPNEGPKAIPRQQINALHGTISYLRHAYRWASNPVVRVAQQETTVDMPPELDIPWAYLQRLVGCYADSGNHTTNVLLSFDASGHRRLRTTFGIDQSIMSTEDNFFSLFYNWETNCVPLYFEIIRSVVAFEESRHMDCENHLENISVLLRKISAIFHSGLTEQKISKSKWMRFTQGFHGWGLEKVVDNRAVVHNGVSGSHVLVFHVIDAFLGLEPYLPNDEMELYVPLQQRQFSTAVRHSCFRHEVSEDRHPSLYARMQQLAQQMRTFRCGHRKRVMPYLKCDAPERRHMTNGKAIDGSVEIEEALKPLDDLLIRRIRHTK